MNIWDINALKPVRSIDELDTGVWCGTYDKTGDTIICGTSKGNLYTIDHRSCSKNKIHLENPSKISWIDLSPNNHEIVVSGDNSYLAVFDYRKISGGPIASATFPRPVANCSKFSPDGSKICASLFGGGFYIYSASDLSELVSYVYPIKIEGTFEVGLMQDKHNDEKLRIVVGDSDKQFRVYDYDQDKKSIVTVKEKEACHGDAIKMVNVEHKDLLVTGSRDGVGKVWNKDDFEYRGRIVGHMDQIVSSSFQPGNKGLFLTASWDLHVNVYDMNNLPNLPVTNEEAKK